MSNDTNIESTLEQEVTNLEKILVQLETLERRAYEDRKLTEGKLMQTRAILNLLRSQHGKDDEAPPESSSQE